jgi:hypothetical protein
MRSFAAAVMMLALAAALAGGSAALRVAALVVAVVTLGLPFVVHVEPPLLAFIVALLACWGTVRVVDLCRERPARSWRLRVWHVLAAFDTRDTTRVPARVDRPTLSSAVAHAAFGGAGLALLVYAVPQFAGPTRATVRWLGGAIFVYGVAGAVADGVRSSYLLVGVSVPPIQRAPVFARTLREFWGQRWNRVVGRWLRETLFVPLARRRRPATGLLLAFVVSALLHGYLTLASVGLDMAIPMTAFFLVQGVLVLVERGLRVERWRPVPARIWFFTSMLVSLPLFVEPMLAVVLPDPKTASSASTAGSNHPGGRV